VPNSQKFHQFNKYDNLSRACSELEVQLQKASGLGSNPYPLNHEDYHINLKSYISITNKHQEAQERY